MKKTFIFAIGVLAGVIAKHWYDNNKNSLADKVETKIKDEVYTKAEKILHTAVYGVPRTNRVQRPKYEHKVDYSSLNNRRNKGYAMDFFSLKDATDFLKSIKKTALCSNRVYLRDIKVLKGEDYDGIYDEKHGWYNFDSAYIQYVDTWGVYQVVLGPIDF